MKITKVSIPIKETAPFGLNEIKMDKLGEIVLLTGKNGSGKSRILNLITSKLTHKPHKYHINQAKEIIAINKENIKKILPELIKYDENQKLYIQNNLKHHESEIRQNQEIINWNLIETDILNDGYPYVYFVPKRLELTDWKELRYQELETRGHSLNTIGVDSLAQGTYSRIKVIQDHYYDATHIETNTTEADRQYAIQDYNKLKELIKIFLNTDLQRVKNEPYIFGFPLGQSKLSDGQKILLQFCLAIHCQRTALSDLIIIMDEPDNHLHPSIIIETIERIKTCAFKGQIWISTHSVPLLAHFDPRNIWYVEDGQISYAGKIPEKVLKGLLGNEEEIARLQNFIALPAQLASTNFAYQCLFYPQTVFTSSDDKQSRQIQEILFNDVASHIRVLDYGVGKGRTISNLNESSEKEKLTSKLEYIAYDEYNSDKEICINEIEKVYGRSDSLYFNDMHELLAKYDKGSFDIVLMCNVLHEIDPLDWLDLFKQDGIISQLLKDTGALMLIEDYRLPYGEKAYQKGFVLLDTPEIKELFKIDEKDQGFIVEDNNKEGRLKCHLIPKEYLQRIDENTRVKALKSVSNNARTNILKLRRDPNAIDFKSGQLHGLWTQLYANAGLALSQLVTEKSQGAFVI